MRFRARARRGSHHFALIAGALFALTALSPLRGTMGSSGGPTTSLPPGARSADVVIYGATPSGIMAAIAASRAGRSVDLLEPSDRIGGMMTSGISHSDVGVKGTIAGLALEFFRATGSLYQLARFGQYEAWDFEPSVGLAAFQSMLSGSDVRLFTGERLRETDGVRLEGSRILSITMESGHTYAAAVFVDSTYEGDLMAQATVPFTWGREGRDQYDEPLAGVQAAGELWPPTDAMYQVGGTERLPGVSSARGAPIGSADRQLQSYGFRLCVTTIASNRIPFAAPTGYSRSRYIAVLRYLTQGKAWGGTLTLDKIIAIVDIPNGKADINSLGPLSLDDVGANYGYAVASSVQRQAMWETHFRYEAGLLYFLSTDAAVPIEIRVPLSAYGLCADEYPETDHWPPLLYVREARRMVSDQVLTQADLTPDAPKRDAVGLASYRIDDHNVQLFADARGYLATEGSLSQNVDGPYDIPYGILIPPRGSVTNLLDSVTVSASHVAYASLRMEPQYMIMGQAAGLAAARASSAGVAVQDVDVAALQDDLVAEGVLLRRPAVGSFPWLPGLGLLLGACLLILVLTQRGRLAQIWARLRRSE